MTEHAIEWDECGRERIARYDVFSVSASLARSPRTGEMMSFNVVEMADCVQVVPVTEAGKIVMAHQYRHGAGMPSLEFPAGRMEPGETPADAAARELLEETGYVAESITLMQTVRPDPAILTNRIHVLSARACVRVREPVQDEGEAVLVRIVPPDEVDRLIRDGVIHHSVTIAAWFFFSRFPELRP